MIKSMMYIVLVIYTYNELMRHVSSSNFVSIIITAYRQLGTLFYHKNTPVAHLALLQRIHTVLNALHCHRV